MQGRQNIKTRLYYTQCVKTTGFYF